MTEYTPRDSFVTFHNRDKRWSVLVCHRRAGKTVACVMELLTRALASKKNRPQYAYIAPLFVQAKQITWDYLKEYGAQVIERKNESELYVELINGAKIFVLGADNPDRLRGLYLDGVVFDEFADMKERIFSEVVRPALADRKGWAVFIGTPKGENAFYDIYQQSKTDPDWFSMMLKASDSGILPADEIHDMKKTMSAEQAEQELECSFSAAIQGAIYAKQLQSADIEGRVTRVPYDSVSEVFTAWDLGFGDSTAIWWLQFVGRELRWLECYENSGEQLDHYAQVVKSKPYNYGKHYLPHDGGHGNIRGDSVSKQLLQMGLPNVVLPRESDIVPGIETLRQTIGYSVFDAEKCRDGLRALRQYQYEWDDQRRLYKRKPKHDWTSHYADAARYAAIAAGQFKGGLVRAKPMPLQINASSYMGV